MLALLLLAALQVQGQPGPRVRHAGPGGEYPSAREALAAARAGDTIFLAAGSHAGPLRITLPRLVLTGDAEAVVDGGATGTTISVEADSVEIRGLTIRNSGRSLDHDQAGVKLVRCVGCAVRDNRLEGILHGIYLLSSADAVISGNRISGIAELPEARRGNGIHLFDSGGAEIVRNSIRATRDGIYFSFASGNRIDDNDVSGVRYGLHYMYSDDNSFERNRFTRNAAGAAIMFSSRIVLRENSFSEHVGYRAYGILLQTAYQVTAERNRMVGNLVGVFLDMSENNLFRGNEISGNGIGIDMIASAEGNTFTANSITRNRVSVRKPNGQARNEWAVDGRGNHWGDRSIYDLDRDGIGDRPYSAGDPFASLAADRPALEIFAGTPAALALSWAERAFPVFDLPRVEDPNPLMAPPREPAAGAVDRSGRPSGAGALLLLPLAAGAVHIRRRRAASRDDGR